MGLSLYNTHKFCSALFSSYHLIAQNLHDLFSKVRIAQTGFGGHTKIDPTDHTTITHIFTIQTILSDNLGT